MTDSFAAQVVAAVRQEAYRRAQGGFGWRLYGVFAPLLIWGIAEPRGDRGRFSKAAMMTAVSEAAERFTPLERRRFELRQEVPDWFWPWVEERAKSWDSEV